MDNLEILGKIIREHRQNRRLTGEELSRQVGLSQSKISKIETGAVANPRVDELRKIMNILEMPEVIRQQIYSNLPTKEDRSYKIKAEYPYRRVLNMQRRSKNIRLFTINIIPSLLQTPEYRQHLGDHLELDEKSKIARMKTIVERQDMLWDQKRRYVFLIHETAMYTRIAPKTAQLTQLDRVERFIGLPHIKVGIIPVQAGLTSTENGGFALYDKSCIILRSTGDQITHDHVEVVAYSKIYAELEKLASYENDARKIINRAMRLYP